jgi:hypothetical protein
VRTEPSVPRLPLSSVLMVADARNHLPGVSTVTRPKERCWLHATQEVSLVITRFERPNDVETPDWTGRIVVTHATSVGKDLGHFSDNQPPETAGSMMIPSPVTSAVSSPSRSRMWSLFTKTFTCRLTVPVSSQMPRYNEGCRHSSSSSTARTSGAESMISQTPLQQARSSRGTWIVMVFDRAIENQILSIGYKA